MSLPVLMVPIAVLMPGLAFSQSDTDQKQCGNSSPVIAIPACTRLIQRDSNGDQLFNSYLNRGNANFLLRDYKSAIADYSIAIERWPQFTVSYVNRAAVYFEIGQLDSAIADYDYVIKETPDFVGAYRGRGRALEAKGATASAIADYKKAIEIEPTDSVAVAGLKRLVP